MEKEYLLVTFAFEGGITCHYYDDCPLDITSVLHSCDLNDMSPDNEFGAVAWVLYQKGGDFYNLIDQDNGRDYRKMLDAIDHYVDEHINKLFG